MLSDLFPFRFTISTPFIAGAVLWSLALYVGFSPLSDWVMQQINRWLNYAEGFLYTSKSELEQYRRGWESRNALYASLLSIVPFLGAGGLLNYGVEMGLGQSWAISMGLIACIGGGVYELGRRDGQASD